MEGGAGGVREKEQRSGLHVCGTHIKKIREEKGENERLIEESMTE